MDSSQIKALVFDVFGTFDYVCDDFRDLATQLGV